MTDEYDLAKAERMLISARSAMGKTPALAAQRLELFPELVEAMDGVIIEVRRIRVQNASAIAEAMDEMRTIIRKEIDDAMGKHAKLMLAAEVLREGMKLTRKGDLYLWSPSVTDSEFSGACDRLFIALLEAQP